LSCFVRTTKSLEINVIYQNSQTHLTVFVH